MAPVETPPPWWVLYEWCMLAPGPPKRLKRRLDSWKKQSTKIQHSQWQDFHLELMYLHVCMWEVLCLLISVSWWPKHCKLNRVLNSFGYIYVFVWGLLLVMPCARPQVPKPSHRCQAFGVGWNEIYYQNRQVRRSEGDGARKNFVPLFQYPKCLENDSVCTFLDSLREVGVPRWTWLVPDF